MCLLEHALQAAGRGDALRSALVEVDAKGVGYLSSEQLEQALHAAGIKFTRHQIITLHRRMDREHQGSVLTDDLLAALSLHCMAS